MKGRYALLAAGTVLLLASGCASTDTLNARISALEDRVGKLEQAQKADMTALDAGVKKADDAAARAEAAAKKADEAAVKAETAEQATAGAEKKAESAAKKSAKEFELMQKK